MSWMMVLLGAAALGIGFLVAVVVIAAVASRGRR